MGKYIAKDSIIGLKDLRDNVDKYIVAIHQGKRFTVFKHSKPVFAIVPPEEMEYDLQELDGPGWKTLVRFPNKKGVTVDDFMKALERRRHGQDSKVRS